MWTTALNYLKSPPDILKNKEGKDVKLHPRVPGIVLILSALIILALWGGLPTTPRDRASNLQPPHPLDGESHRRLQTAVDGDDLGKVMEKLQYLAFLKEIKA